LRGGTGKPAHTSFEKKKDRNTNEKERRNGTTIIGIKTGKVSSLRDQQGKEEYRQDRGNNPQKYSWGLPLG